MVKRSIGNEEELVLKYQTTKPNVLVLVLSAQASHFEVESKPWCKFLIMCKLVQHFQVQGHKDTRLPFQLQLYLRTQLRTYTFWRNNNRNFPVLAKIANDALPRLIERLFSIAGNIFSPECCRLTDKRFTQLMFVRCYVQFAILLTKPQHYYTLSY